MQAFSQHMANIALSVLCSDSDLFGSEPERTVHKYLQEYYINSFKNRQGNELKMLNRFDILQCNVIIKSMENYRTEIEAKPHTEKNVNKIIDLSVTIDYITKYRISQSMGYLKKIGKTQVY